MKRFNEGLMMLLRGYKQMLILRACKNSETCLCDLAEGKCAHRRVFALLTFLDASGVCAAQKKQSRLHGLQAAPIYLPIVQC